MNFKKELLKYLRYWPWFLLSLILCLGAAIAFIKITPPTYQTSALIFIDKKQEENKRVINDRVEKKSVENNVSDEVKLITSNSFLIKVIKNLSLNFSYFEKGYTVNNQLINEVPFILKSKISEDLLPDVSYDIRVNSTGFVVTNTKTEKTYNIEGFYGNQDVKDLPFKIYLSSNAKKNISTYLDKEYSVVVKPTASAIKDLKASLGVVYDEETSKETIQLNYVGTNPERSQKILNEIISLLDKNIIDTKQRLLTNTVTYLNKRIKEFNRDKDSIESIKERYLKENDILVMDNYIAENTVERNQKEESYQLNERQISLTNLAINDIKNAGLTETLGTDYKLDAPTVNQLLINYNLKLMDSEVILQRAQKNNPAYISLIAQLKVQKQGILNTLNSYLNFLNQTSQSTKAQQSIANTKAKSIPTKGRKLDNINNNLDLKKETYVALLQKREEAILNGAILESNITTLTPPETDYAAIFPQPKSFLIGSFLLGVLIPFGFVFMRTRLDTKIHNEEDILDIIPEVPVVGHIPKISSNEKLENTANSRSTIAEASRILVSNITHLLPKNNETKGSTILFTSSIQSEGKSFCAFHNAITLSNLNKKVLLIGVDLRNPQLHDYFDIEKNVTGLSNFLSNKTQDWKSLLQKSNRFSENLDVLFSGEIPPNPTQLLTNANFDLLLNEAKKIYDYVILDTAPVQLVSDTLNFSSLADVTVFVVKYDFTDKVSLTQVKNLIKKEQLKNVGIVINGVNMKTAYGYGYNYKYGYNYSYKYTEKSTKKPWFKKKILSVNEA